ncbi:hypothetical protein H4582DRAFT_1930758 [Lactarius indigo]|nr:hypothetical protein H4582DRAFT_1930758 [Lactarius indigo]
MYTHPNPSPYYRPSWGYQAPPVDPPALPSMSTIALQDIVEGQQRATNGLVSLLSQERTTTESNTREQKQQLANLASLSQHFLTFMPDVEQKFSALEASIRANCTNNNDNVELQNRVKDMVEVVASLGRIAEGFACSTGLRLVPGLAPNPWAWVPANAQPLQQDPTSFSASFTQAPRLFPAAIPNSTRSSVFAHSTGPSRSVHWPSDLDVPTTSWAPPPTWSDPYFPVQFGANTAYRASRSSLCSGMRAPSAGPYSYSAPVPYPPTASDPSPPPTPTPDGSPYVSRLPFDIPSSSLPAVPSPPLGPIPPPRPILTPSQTESVVGSIRRTSLSPITERTSQSSAIPPPPTFGRAPANGPSPSTSSIETFSTPSGIVLNHPPAVPPSRFSVSTAPSGPIPPNWFGTIYPRTASTASSIDGYTMPSPPSPRPIEIPNLGPADTVHWSSLFPSAPIIIERPAPDDILLRSSTPDPDESVASPMSSPVRSIVSYTGSTNPSMASEPMTPLSHASVVPLKAPSDKAIPSTSTSPEEGTAVASTSNATVPSSTAPTPSRNPLAIQLVSFFFDTVQRLFKVPGTVDLSYGGFEVAFSTDSISWENNAFYEALGALRDADAAAEDRREFELMPAPANAALHRYIKELARVRMDLAALQAGEGEGKEDPAVEQLVLRVKAEQETVQSWMKRVCSSAGALSIADPKFSPRK